MVGAPREVPLTRFTASDGSVFAVGTIVGAYDNPMRSSTWPDKHALSRAYADFSTLIETMASTPGTRPFDVLTADKLPDVVINLPRVFSDSTLVGHGVLVTTGGKNEKPKEKVYLFFGACAKRDLPGFQRHLRTAGYPQGRK